MKLEDALAAIGEPETIDAVMGNWEASLMTQPADRPSFLCPSEFKVSRHWAGLDAEIDPVLEAGADRIVDNQALLDLAWYCHNCLFEYDNIKQFTDWPTLEPALGELAGVFYLLVALGLAPRLRALHESMGVPEQVTRDCCRQISAVDERYQTGHGGRRGIDKRVLYWLRHYVNGILFRTGRFEYMIKPFWCGVVGYRNRQTGEVVALAEDGARFDGEGQAARSGDESAEVWTATPVEDDAAFTGYPISPEGMAIRSQVSLPRSAWERVLGREHNVLQMHIPGGGSMTPERCGESLREAIRFFSHYFPDEPFVGIACTSWIFNTQLQDFLPRTANLPTFQRELYLFPVPSSGLDGVYFIYGREDITDWTTAPRGTTLHRAISDHLAAGGRLRNGGMFILTEDLQHFGSEHYRSGWPPADVRREIGSAG